MALQTPVTDATAPLFSTELISPEVLKALPEGYTCRPIQRQDYHNGFLDVLRVLTTVGDVSEEVLGFSLNRPLTYGQTDGVRKLTHYAF